MDRIIFSKILFENKPHRICLEVGKSLNLTVLDSDTAWKQTINLDTIEVLAKQHSLTTEIYLETLGDYLNESPSNITFSFIKNEFTITRLLERKLKLTFFTCKLEKVNFNEEALKLIDRFSAETVDIVKKLNAVNREHETLIKNNISCASKLKELLRAKQEDEEHLYESFTLILNEKKLCIQHLTELLEAFRGGRRVLSERSGAKTEKIEKMETISDSEPEDEEEVVTTDDETIHDEEDEPRPSTSTANLDILDDLPSSVVLPKRRKVKTSGNTVVVEKPKGCELKLVEKDTENDQNKSPVLSYNTQELLDML